MKNFSKKQKISTLTIILLVIVTGILFLPRDTGKEDRTDTLVNNMEKTDEKEALVDDATVEEKDREISEDVLLSKNEVEDENAYETEPSEDIQSKPSANDDSNANIEKPSNSQSSNNNQSTGTGNNSSSNGGSNASSGTTQTPQKPEEKPNETPKEEPKPEPAPEPQKPASMYSNGDSISKQRFNGCASILRSGKAGAYAQVTSDYINYFDSIYIANPTTNGAWFMISVHDWPSASYPDDLDPEVIAAYKELPGLVRSCITTVAPDGGAGLYSTVSSLINSYGAPRNVPTQGRVSESIPGLYVEIVNARSEMQIFFYAE